MSNAAPDPKSTAGKIAALRQRLADATGAATGADTGALVEAAVSGTVARQRIGAILDPGSFTETDALAVHRCTAFGADKDKPLTDGVVTGWGRIDGRRVCIYSQDRDIFAGTMGEVHGEKIIKIMDLAAKTGVPVIAIHDSDGPRLVEGIAAMSAHAKVVRRAVLLSGVVPQITIVAGHTGGGHGLLPALGDLTVMVAGSSLVAVDAHTAALEASKHEGNRGRHAAGSSPAQASNDADQSAHGAHGAHRTHSAESTGSALTDELLGGAAVHAEQAGTSHYTAESFEDAAAWVRQVVGFVPLNNRAAAPMLTPDPAAAAAHAALASLGTASTDTITTDTAADHERRATELNSIVPDCPATPYDMVDVIHRIVDDHSLLTIQPDYADAMITAFARVSGRSVGIVANQPMSGAGALTAETCEKAARFIRLCDSFNVPVIAVVDCPGMLPGADHEHAGAVRRSAKLLYAWAEATVGIITVITRKAHGIAWAAMGAKDMGADLCLAWPTAEITVGDDELAVPTVHAEDLAKAKRKGKDTDALLASFSQQWTEQMLSPYGAAERGLVDAVIEPSTTRAHLIEGLRLLERKAVALPAKKHGNIPL